jgi:carboxymethylenebutenolidase
MKSLVLVYMLLIACSVNTQAQNCCVKKGGDWKTLAMSKAFRESHESPEPFHYESDKGSMISFNTDDGKQGNAYYVPSDQPTNKVLLIFHEWWGLNDYIKREAVRWQGLLGNIDVYAVDLYDGQVTDDPGTASKLAGNLDHKRAESIIRGVLVKAGKDKLFATLGWCMGGSWSFAATLDATNQAAACVMYYGFPEKDKKKIGELRTDILYIWGNQDQFITKDLVTNFGEAIKATGHKFDFHEFNGPHAFANPSNPKYQKNIADQAEDIAVNFLKKKLQL